MAKKKARFEDCIEEIDKEIQKRKGRWTLSAITWMDYSDVSQMIKVHIWKKWSQYDQKRPLAPWLNRIISNQIKNLIRDKYGNFCRPCLSCAAAEGMGDVSSTGGNDLCIIYGRQGPICPEYKNWLRGKKQAYDAKLPVSLEHHPHEAKTSERVPNIEDSVGKLHIAIQKYLKPIEKRVYKFLYIDHLDEIEVAKKMGYITTERNRNPGYRQIKNVKKEIIRKVKKHLESGDIDL